VIISAQSTVSLAQLQTALGALYPKRPLRDWSAVGTSCLSIETANASALPGGMAVGQQESWRLGGCSGGNYLAVFGLENHVRIWSQSVPGLTSPAYFLTASVEQTCLLSRPPFLWHCIVPDGYDEGAAKFVADVQAAGAEQGWSVAVRVDQRAAGSGGSGAGAGAGVGLRDARRDGVAFSSDVYVVTVTS
jgi:hypothetical protein